MYSCSQMVMTKICMEVQHFPRIHQNKVYVSICNTSWEIMVCKRIHWTDSTDFSEPFFMIWTKHLTRIWKKSTWRHFYLIPIFAIIFTIYVVSIVRRLTLEWGNVREGNRRYGEGIEDGRTHHNLEANHQLEVENLMTAEPAAEPDVVLSDRTLGDSDTNSTEDFISLSRKRKWLSKKLYLSSIHTCITWVFTTQRIWDMIIWYPKMKRIFFTINSQVL